MTCGRPITSRSRGRSSRGPRVITPLIPLCFRQRPRYFPASASEEKSATILTIGISPYLRCNANVPSTFLPPPPQPQPNPLSPSVSSLPDSPRLFCTAQQLVIRLVSFLSLSLPPFLSFSAGLPPSSNPECTAAYATAFPLLRRHAITS